MVLLSMSPLPLVKVSHRIIMGLRLKGKDFWLKPLSPPSENEEGSYEESEENAYYWRSPRVVGYHVAQ